MMFIVQTSSLMMLQLDVEHVQLLGVVDGDVLQDLGEVLLHTITGVKSELVASVIKIYFKHGFVYK
jgi:hypothetical protein